MLAAAAAECGGRQLTCKRSTRELLENGDILGKDELQRGGKGGLSRKGATRWAPSAQGPTRIPPLSLLSRLTCDIKPSRDAIVDSVCCQAAFSCADGPSGGCWAPGGGPGFCIVCQKSGQQQRMHDGEAPHTQQAQQEGQDGAADDPLLSERCGLVTTSSCVECEEYANIRSYEWVNLRHSGSPPPITGMPQCRVPLPPLPAHSRVNTVRRSAIAVSMSWNTTSRKGCDGWNR